MWQHIKGWFATFHASFHDSEVILFARVQVAVGIIWAVLIATDLSPLFSDPKWFTVWVVITGLVTEFARRNRADDLGAPVIPDVPEIPEIKEPA